MRDGWRGRRAVGGQERMNESRGKIMCKKKKEESGTSGHKLCLPRHLGEE